MELNIFEIIFIVMSVLALIYSGFLAGRIHETNDIYRQIDKMNFDQLHKLYKHVFDRMKKTPRN